MFDGWLETNCLNEVDVSVITQAVMVKFFTFIIEDRKLSKVSIKKYRQILSQVFNHVRKEKERKQFINPCFDLPETKRLNDSAPQPIQELDIEIFKEVIEKEDPQLWLAISFEYYCFIRPGKELRLLKIGDIDFGRRTVRVNPVNSKTVERNIGIPAVFLNALRNDYKLHTYDRKMYVFGRDRVPGNEHYGKNNLRYRFSRIRDKMKMPEMYKLYSWKHTGNIRALESGISISEIQMQNGHTSIQTTENYMKNKKRTVSSNITNRFPEL
jgi:integrase